MIVVSSVTTKLSNDIDQLLARCAELSEALQRLTAPEPGPYAIFNHLSLLHERLEDVKTILGRIGDARNRVTELNRREERDMPQAGLVSNKPASQQLQALASEKNQLVRQMRLDAESLYIFCNLCLDQWVLVIAYCLGLDDPMKYKFAYLMSKFDAKSTIDRLVTLKSQHQSDAVWLHYVLRFFRNEFIEHPNRPWQRGSTMAVIGNDFTFFICSPVGWISTDREMELIDSISDFVPQWVKDLEPRHWQRRPRAMLEATYREIDQIPRPQDREKIWMVWSELGGSTVSYDVVATRFIRFVSESVQTVLQEIKRFPENINLGLPNEIESP